MIGELETGLVLLAVWLIAMLATYLIVSLIDWLRECW